MALPVCTVCGEALPPRSRPGNPRRYCSSRCRTEAYRDRQARSFYEPVGPQPNATALVRAELAAVVDEVLEVETHASPEDRLVRAVIETRTLADTYKRLEPELPNGLGWRAGDMGVRLERAVDDLFPTPKDKHE